GWSGSSAPPVCSTKDAEGLLARLAYVRRSGTGWMAACPVHEADASWHRPQDNSLSIGVGRDGRLLLHCFAGCSYEAIVAALGLSGAELRAPTPHRGTAPPPPSRIRLRDVQAAHVYVSASIDRLLRSPAGGHALGYLAGRFAIDRPAAIELFLGYDPGSPSIERPPFCGLAFRTPRLIVPLIAAGGFTGFQGRALGVQEPRWVGPSGAGWGRVGILALGRSGPVILCEGPSDALAAVGAGYPAAFVRGAGLCRSAASTRRTLAPLVDDLQSRTVIVAGDGDEAGRRFTREAGAFLRSVGMSVRTCDPGDGLDLAAIGQRQGSDALRALLEEARRGG